MEHIYGEYMETVHFRPREQQTPGEVLRFFMAHYYLMYYYDENKRKYKQIKALSTGPIGRAGQQPPDNG